jgi:hypothetical protein
LEPCEDLKKVTERVSAGKEQNDKDSKQDLMRCHNCLHLTFHRKVTHSSDDIDFSDTLGGRNDHCCRRRGHGRRPDDLCRHRLGLVARKSSASLRTKYLTCCSVRHVYRRISPRDALRCIPCIVDKTWLYKDIELTLLLTESNELTAVNEHSLSLLILGSLDKASLDTRP